MSKLKWCDTGKKLFAYGVVKYQVYPSYFQGSYIFVALAGFERLGKHAIQKDALLSCQKYEDSLNDSLHTRLLGCSFFRWS